MNLVVKSPVWDDLREIGSRIAIENPDAAERFLTATEQAFEMLKRHPRLGRLRSFSLPGLRSLVIPRFQTYIIFYLALESEVQILAVLHGARDLSRVLEGRME